MSFPNNLYYTKEHEWIRVDGDKVYIGITDYAQNALGDIVFVELPEVGTELNKGDVFGVVESVKAASDSYIPVNGKVLEINTQLEDQPELINENAYDAWIVAIELRDKSELETLLNAEVYEKFCESL
ncbi:glycine cleavage system h protein [Holotrichia oblita]|nr:glycine cleavage system h protein [Holotrichia oblita]